ncbi:MAG: hypothetical protein V1887_01115 [Candidatus Aenigmatarchaeota archaeon]
MPEEAPMQPDIPEMPPGVPQGPPEMPSGPVPERKKGWKMALAAIIVIAAVGGGMFAFGEKLTGPNYSGPTAAFVLSGEDLPTGWFIAQKMNQTEDATGFISGYVTLSQKNENSGEVSTVFSYAWLFNDTKNAESFRQSLWDKAATGNYTELSVKNIEGCSGILKPFPVQGDWAYVICRNGNLVWKVESRSTISAAHLYAPMFAGAVSEKVNQK